MASRFKLNLAGLREVKRGPEVTAVVEEVTQRIAAAARGSATDEYYGAHIYANIETHPIAGSVGHVLAGSKNALRVEALHGTLVRSLGAA